MSQKQHWAQIGETTFIFGIWLLYWVHKLLGRWPFLICLYPVVFSHWLLRPALRASSLQYLQRIQAATGAVGHEPNWRDSLRHIARFAETVLDKLLAVSGRYPFHQVSVEGRETFYANAEAGHGGIIVTAHIGCLELCRAMAEQRAAVKLNILVHTRHAEAFNRLLKRLNPNNDLRLIEVTDMSPATALLLSDKVANGEFVVIAGDRVPVTASKTVSINFLGHDALLPIGPYVLASLLKCPLYLLGCIHEKNGYTVHFQRLTEHVELPRNSRQQALTAYAQTYANALTELLKRSPYDWFNFFPFWDQNDDDTQH